MDSRLTNAVSELQADLALALATHACDNYPALVPTRGIFHGISSDIFQLSENAVTSSE